MSDEEYEYSDDEEYDYGSDENEQNESGEGMDNTAIEIENCFYEAEDLVRDGIEQEKALGLFQKVIELEQERNPKDVKFRLKALEHCVLLYMRLGNAPKMFETYQQLLGFLDTVTRNECNETINNILEQINKYNAGNFQVVDSFYHSTLETLRQHNKLRLWFTTNIKLGKIYLEAKNYQRLQDVVKDLKEVICQENKELTHAVSESIGSTYLLEAYALEIALYEAQDKRMKLKELYKQTVKLSTEAAIQDPRIMGNIKETGGRLSMEESRWADAYDEFFDAFRNYQEAGNARAKILLKYVVLASMLALKDINPFDSREAKVFKEDSEVKAIVALRDAFEARDIIQFEKILNDKSAVTIRNDEFIMKYVKSLLRKMRLQVLLQLLAPYKRISLEFLSNKMNINKDKIEALLVELILDEKIKGRIDQVNMTFCKEFAEDCTRRKLVALDQWTSALKSSLLSASVDKMHDLSIR